MAEEIASIQKNALEKIMAVLGEYRGEQRIDIRTYFQPKQSNPDYWQPTKKGINLSPENWKEFKKLVEKVDQFVIKKVGS